MAYTNSWTTVAPAGSAAANTADDEIRKLRLDMEERMNDLVNDWTVDPVVLKSEGPSGVRWRHWSEGVLDRGTEDYENFTSRVLISDSISTNSRVWYAPMPLTVGTTLTDVTARVNRVNVTAAITLQVIKISNNADPPLETALMGTVTSSSTGWEDLSSGVLSEVIDVDHVYLAVVTLKPDGTTANTAQFLAYKFTAS
ncbi:hypothetical protein LCGC14_2880610 [marine sediment metagenome]|uniref:Uncharacterized protein n=1 Tax=marine sediment metagenome TaxID=412755 RepID=A0A0F8Y062_9ZZZZ